METNMIVEKPFKAQSGWLFLVIFLGLLVAGPAIGIHHGVFANGEPPAWKIIAIITTSAAGFIGMFGFLAIAPNDSRVLLLFGNYNGTVKESGFYWVNPFYSKKKV
jgi:hypothetical protein